jgi:hypothetical protein
MSSDRVEEVAQNSPVTAWAQKVPERPGERNALPPQKNAPYLSAILPDFALSDPGSKNGERTTKATIESAGEHRDL